MQEELSALPDHLNARRTGVGKVNGAIAAGRVLSSIPPQGGIVLIVGTAAAADPSLKIGDVVISNRTGYHDVDVTALNFAPGQIPYEDQWTWESDADLARLTAEICKQLGLAHVHGPILTGDQFVSDPARVAWIHKTFNAAAIEMETAAIAQTLARRPNVRWLGIRVISDLADKSAAVDFPTFLPQAAQTIAKIVTNIVEKQKLVARARTRSRDKAWDPRSSAWHPETTVPWWLR